MIDRPAAPAGDGRSAAPATSGPFRRHSPRTRLRTRWPFSRRTAIGGALAVLTLLVTVSSSWAVVVMSLQTRS